MGRALDGSVAAAHRRERDPASGRRRRAIVLALAALLLVGGVGAVVGLVVVPRRVAAQKGANEAAAVARLRGLHEAMTLFVAQLLRDDDGDGICEFAFPDELVAAGLLPAFVPVEHGYRVRVWLPAGIGGAERRGDAADRASIDRRERRWVAVAAPIDARSGNLAFAITNRGEAYASPASSWPADGPAWSHVVGRDWLDDPATGWWPHLH